MNFDFQPTLTGELLTLRPLTPDDWHDLFRVASDPLIWAQHPCSDRHEEKVFRAFFAEAIASGGAFAVLDKASAGIIGSTRFRAGEDGEPGIEIGWTFLARAYWGGRYNGEMKRLMLAHAFRFVDRVVFLVGESNIRSQKAVERIGGVRCGVVEKPGDNGRPRRSLKYAIHRPG